MTEITGIQFTDIKLLKLILNQLTIDKGRIESLSANDCVLIQQPSPKTTTFTVNDPNRASLTLNYIHDPLNELAGGFNTNSTLTTESGEIVFYNWSSVIHFPDLLEKVARLHKINVNRTLLCQSNKGGYQFKSTVIYEQRTSNSTLIVKSYPGATSDFITYTAASFFICKLNGRALTKALKVINTFGECSKEKRELGAGKQVLFCFNLKENNIKLLTSLKSSDLSNCHVTVPITLSTEEKLNDNVSNTIAAFGIESRYIRQLLYISEEDNLHVYIKLVAGNSLITFSSIRGSLTVNILKPNHRLLENLNFFLPGTSYKYKNVDIVTRSLDIYLLQEVINALNNHIPVTVDTFINKIILLKDTETNTLSFIPANDIRSKESSQVECLLTHGEPRNFIILSNLLMTCLRILHMLFKLGEGLNENEYHGILFKVKEIVGPRVTTLNLFLQIVTLQKVNNTFEYLYLNEDYQIWIGVDNLESNMDNLQINE